MRLKLIAIFGFLILSLCTGASAQPIVVLLTDFGLQNEAVGLCHGAILSINSNIQIVDLTHHVKPYDVREAGRILSRATNFPKGTVFIAVVDPGVGTKRTSLAVKTKQGFYYVAPNNGLLTEVINSQGLELGVLLDEKKVSPSWQRGTFDGRDLYSPAGALLANANGDLFCIGRSAGTNDIVMIKPIKAQVDVAQSRIVGLYVQTDEPYGNVWTNISQANLDRIGLMPGDRLKVRIGKVNRTVPFVITFGNVAKETSLAYLNSEGRLGLAINMGDIRRKWKLNEGDKIMIQKVCD